MAYEENYKCQVHLDRIIAKRQKQQDKAVRALEDHIDKKRRNEFKHSFEITHEKRHEMFSAWLWSRSKGFPLNTMLTWEFEINPKDQSQDVDHVRSVAHHCLMYLRRRGKIPSHLQWSRFIAKGDNKECCTVLLHVPPHLYGDFKKFASRWDGHNIEVNQCTYNRDWDVGIGQLVTSFDILMKATSRTTQRALKDVYSEESDIIFRPRVFTSEKLSKEEIEKEFKTYQVMKELERIGRAVQSKTQ